MEECTDPNKESVKEGTSVNLSGGQNVQATNLKKSGKICNVKDAFPQIEVPEESIHIIQNVNDWDKVAAVFLETVYRTKVVGYHSIYLLTSSGTQPQHPTSILQLATVGGPILIFQLNKLVSMPLALKRLLAEPQIIKVGVGVYNLARRLEGDHDVIISGTLDLRALSEKVGLPDRIYMSLPDLSKAFLGRDLGIMSSSSKAVSVRISYWHREDLRSDQKHYAAVFAYGALSIFIEMIGMKICDFKDKIGDKDRVFEAWNEGQNLWRDILNQDRRFTAFYCEICDVNPGMQRSYDSHISGHRHRRSVDKLKRIEQYGDLVDVPVNMPKTGDKSNTLDTNQSSGKTMEKLFDASLWCSVCQVGMHGMESMNQHKAGQKHRKKVKQKLEAGEVVDNDILQGTNPDEQKSIVPDRKQEFRCELCDLTVPTEASMAFHLNGQKHKKKVARKEKVEEMIVEKGYMLNASEIESIEDDNSRRYCDACEVVVHNNHNWLMHVAGKNHKKNKEKLEQLEVQVNCNSEFGSKRPTVDDLSGSVYCGICNTTVMASKENLDSHFQGKKHQTKLKEKMIPETKLDSTCQPSSEVNLSPHMAELAKSVVGTVTPADVGTHDSGIYCKVCRTIVCGGKDSLQSHLRGKKHLKNQQVLGKHKQPFKFPKARTSPYGHQKHQPRPLPWQNSDINDVNEIPGVPAIDFENPERDRNFPRGRGFNTRRNFPLNRGGGGFTRGRGYNRGHCGQGVNFGPQYRWQGQGFLPSQQRHLKNVSSRGNNIAGFSQLQRQCNTTELGAIAGLLDDQALLSELEKDLAGPSSTDVTKRPWGIGRGRSNYTDRHHPYVHE